MDEKLPSSVSELQPGDVIEFANATYKTELPLFEDMVAMQIAPCYTEGEAFEWQHREKLIDLVRPKGNNGTISNVRLVTIGNTYDHLTHLPDNGMKMMKGVNMKHVLSAIEQRKHEYIGFIFTADIKQSGKDVKQIYRKEFYLPWDWGSNVVRPLRSHYSHIRRIHAEPLGDTEPIDFDQLPKKIGFTALKHT